MGKAVRLSEHKQFPTSDHTGVIKQTQKGFVYVSINENMTEPYFQAVKNKNNLKPPYKRKEYENIGNHISVIEEKELNKQEFKDKDKIISFKLKDLYTAVPTSWRDMRRVWFISVESKDLENIRKDYGLSPRLNDHDFHITVAVEPRRRKKKHEGS